MAGKEVKSFINQHDAALRGYQVKYRDKRTGTVYLSTMFVGTPKDWAFIGVMNAIKQHFLERRCELIHCSRLEVDVQSALIMEMGVTVLQQGIEVADDTEITELEIDESGVPIETGFSLGEK